MSERKTGYVFGPTWPTRVASATGTSTTSLRDRRTDVYDEMLGAKMSRGWY